MQYLALTTGAVGAAIIGVAVFQSEFARRGADRGFSGDNDRIVIAADRAIVGEAADCPNLVPMAQLRDVVRDEDGHIIATAFAEDIQEPASAPVQAPIS